MHSIGKQTLLVSSRHHHLPLVLLHAFGSFSQIPILQWLTPSSSLSDIQQTHSYLCKLGPCDELPLLLPQIVTLYAHHRRFEDGLRVFAATLSAGLPPDLFALPSAITSCSSLLALAVSRQIYNLIVRGFSPDAFVRSSLIAAYLKCGELEDVRRVFVEMPIWNLVSWSAMIAGYALAGRANEAESLLVEMRDAGIEPNVVLWNGLISGHVHNGYF